MRPLQVLRSAFVSIFVIMALFALCAFAPASPAEITQTSTSNTTGTTGTTGTPSTTGTTGTTATTATTSTAAPTFSVKQNQETFSPGSDYKNALTVKAIDDKNQPVANASFDVVVISGDARIYTDDKPVGASLALQTGTDGTKNVSIITGNQPDFQINVVPRLNNASQLTKTIPLQLMLGARYKDALSSNRAFAELFMGQTFANNYDSKGDNTGFGSTGQLLALTFDTMWKRPPTLWQPTVQPPPTAPKAPGLLHTELNLAFNQFPFGNAVNKTAAPLENAFTGSLGLAYQPDWWASYSNTSRDEKLHYDAVRWGVFSRAGVTTRGQKATNGDTVIGRFQAGFRFTHHHTAAETPEKEVTNYIPVRFVEVSYGWFEQFQGNRNHSVLIIDGGIRLTPLSNNVIPFYAGFHAAVGPGPDDVRVFAGFLFKLDKLAELIKSNEGQNP